MGPYKRGNLEVDTHTQEEATVKMKEEIKVMLLEANRGQIASKPPEAGREAWNRLSLMASEGTDPETPSSWDSSLQNSEHTFLFKLPGLWHFY